MDYEKLREIYKPQTIEWLFVAESPPPKEGTTSTRHFYRTGVGEGDRLFTNTMKALYPEAKDFSEGGLEKEKDRWLKRFQSDGCYMIEALETSLPHQTKPSERVERIKEAIPGIIERVKKLAGGNTKIILIKSNPFKVLAEPLRDAGFNVLNQEVVNYPGFWQEEAYKKKLSRLVAENGWKA